MPLDSMTYQQLDHALVRLGFVRRHVEPKWLRYEHADSNTITALVERAPHEPVRATDALSARRHLMEKGLVTEVQLDGMLSAGASQQTKLPAKKS